MERPLSPVQRICRLLAGCASAWIAFRMLGGGRHPEWSVVVILSRVIAIIVLLLYAFGSLVQACYVASGGESGPSWFPDGSERGRLLKVIGIELLLILSVGGICVLRPTLGARPVVAGVGVWVIFLTASRNPALWEVRSPLSLRDLSFLFGENVAQVIYLALGLAIVAAAVFASM